MCIVLNTNLLLRVNSELLFVWQEMAIIYDMAVGLKKGHKVTPNTTRKPRPSRRKGVSMSGLLH
jgi:Ribosomal protein L36e